MRLSTIFSTSLVRTLVIALFQSYHSKNILCTFWSRVCTCRTFHMSTCNHTNNINHTIWISNLFSHYKYTMPLLFIPTQPKQHTFTLKSTFTARNPSSTNSRQTPIRKRSPKREEILHPKRQHRQRTPNLPRIPIGSLIHKTKGIVWRKEIEDWWCFGGCGCGGW